MTITNTTRQQTLADKAARAGSFLARGRGLMLSAPLPSGGGLILEPCNSIHMLFMRYPLDILFLNREGRVVFMYQGIKPWRLGRVVKGARLAIELPEGTINTSGTQVGDAIAIA
jgi:uncharacterized membrane protein (UPF0127 family)